MVVVLPNDANICYDHIENFENIIIGTNGNDRILGTPENDLIFGGDGNDRIRGMGGDDCLIGGDGNDALKGIEETMF